MTFKTAPHNYSVRTTSGELLGYFKTAKQARSNFLSGTKGDSSLFQWRYWYNRGYRTVKTQRVVVKELLVEV